MRNRDGAARGMHGVAVFDGRLYAIGGRNEPFSSVERFDLATNTWEVAAALPSARSQLRCCAM